MRFKLLYSNKFFDDLQQDIDWYKDKTIEVIAVFSTHRNPEIWKNLN